MMIRSVPREHDDEVLHWLRLRSGGMSNSQIGRMYGKHGAHIATANNVMRADIAESGEDVRRDYW